MAERETKRVSYSGTMERTQAVKYLEKLVKGLKAGTIGVQQNGYSATVHPNDTINVEVKVKQKSPRESVQIKLGWKHEEPPKEPAELVITDKDAE